MSGLLAGRIATRAIALWVGPRRRASAVEMRIFLTRPFAAAGQFIAGRVTMRRLGRRIAVTSTEVHDAAGKTLLLADAVHVLSGPSESRVDPRQAMAEGGAEAVFSCSSETSSGRRNV